MKSKSIQDKEIRVLEGTKFHKGLIEHSLTHSDKDKCNSCVEQSKTSSLKEERCKCHCHKPESHYYNRNEKFGTKECRCNDVLCDHCQPKTEDTGEIYGDSIISDDYIKEQRIRNARYNKHLDEVKTQQGWERGLSGLLDNKCSFECIRDFISQEIESSNRRLIEIKKQDIRKLFKKQHELENSVLCPVCEAYNEAIKDVLNELKEAGDE